MHWSIEFHLNIFQTLLLKNENREFIYPSYGTVHTQQINNNKQQFSNLFVLSFYMQFYTDDIFLPKFKVVFS